ncbi:hypothetical protein HDU76_000686, partial [Blyttiomyces sp. JEL0837]
FPTVNGSLPSPPGTQMQLGPDYYSQFSYFRLLTTNEQGFYNIINDGTEYCLEAVNNGTTNGSPVSLSTCTGQDNQKWYISPFPYDASGIPAWIVAKQSGRCLVDYTGNFTVGDGIGLLDCIGDYDTYKWHIDYGAFPDKNVVPTPGGKGITNVEVVLLLWGNVNNASSYPDFYKTLLEDPVYEILGQYGIGAGSYKGSMQLPPIGGPALPPGSGFPDVGGYLRNLTQLGYIKPNNNTYYAVHFAPNTGVTCSGFCAYHTSTWIGDLPNQETNEIVYGVMPDLNGCSCGGSNVFESQTMSAAHELFEAVTDPYGGYFDKVTKAEVGDLCAYRTFSITGASGNSYVIQRFWSNVARACVE